MTQLLYFPIRLNLEFEIIVLFSQLIENYFHSEFLIFKTTHSDFCYDLSCIYSSHTEFHSVNFYSDHTEFIDGGTLSDLLLNQSIDLSWKQRIGFAKDIADGMV